VKLENATADVTAIFGAVLKAIDPELLVRQKIVLVGDSLIVGSQRHQLPTGGKVVLLGVGKSAIGMARGVETALGNRLDSGFVVTKLGLGGTGEALRRTTVWESNHPVPGELSVAAGEELLCRAKALDQRDFAIVVVSGGGSALAEAPIEGISLDDFKATTSLLLKGGADISTLNAVRRRLSRIKAGGLARAIAPARIVNLILSDVLGNPLTAIASGLSVASESDDDWRIRALHESAMWDGLPDSVRTSLETAIPAEAVSNVVQSEIVGDAATAARAATEAAVQLGYKPHLLGTAFAGDAREFGRFWAQLACAASNGYSDIQPPACVVGTGEMTVVVRGDGAGGRNTEMAAAAAIELSGHGGVAVASLATDGDDGISGAAGGVVVGDMISRLTAKGFNPEDLLARNDTRAFLEASGGLIVTGQTGTNVNDLYLALITSFQP